MIINIEDEEEMEWGKLKDEEEIIDNINENGELILILMIWLIH